MIKEKGAASTFEIGCLVVYMMTQQYVTVQCAYSPPPPLSLYLLSTFHLTP